MKPFNLDEYLKNPSRKVVTRDGLNARIICTDRKDLKFPIVALIETKSGGEFLQYYTKNGTYYIDDLCDADLLFLPEKHEGMAYDAPKKMGVSILRLEWNMMLSIKNLPVTSITITIIYVKDMPLYAKRNSLQLILWQ